MTSLESAEPATAASPKLRVPVGVIVAIACTAQFVLVLNTTIVNVALPGIHQALGLSVDGQQWVVNGYLVTFGGFLLFAARAGDLFGQKKVFQAGLVIFTLASLAGGLAQDSGWLLAARFVQGLGAAAMTPSTISLIITSPMDNSGGADVYDHTVLADFASRLGIPRTRVEAVRSSNEYADAVRADEKEAKTLGATGVPFTVFDGRIAIPGATSIEGFTNAINRAWSNQ